ncbi:Vacuolar aminopeptidase 1 [Lachnellula arida]|uniref:Vacuolar aminopeptidase 1 n=1 Tax=Lachnellula arida TaxID=1316785 RepID=A0A8T9B123_9HELO|nr:Vacuolar aminopeptidase 1 [Lachnellula arida]
MVKKNPNSLRGSVSTSSLQEQAARQRIAALEEQVASLTAKKQSSSPPSGGNLPVPSQSHYAAPTLGPISDSANRAPPVESFSPPHPLAYPPIRREPTEKGRKSYDRADGRTCLTDPPTLGATRSNGNGSNANNVSREMEQLSLFEQYNESAKRFRQTMKERTSMMQLQPPSSLITKGLLGVDNALKIPEAYTQPFCDFLTDNPTVFHAVSHFETKLKNAGFKKLSERSSWNEEVKTGGKYFVTRNGSSLIAFTVGGGYKSGNGVAMIAGHVDALTARLKPVSNKKTSAGYVQLGVAPYAGALNNTWWDRDLGIGGRVLVKDSKTGKIDTKLVKLGWPIARIPTLAPHFGIGMFGQNNAETQAVPIIGLDNSDIHSADDEFKNLTLGGEGTFAATQPPKLVRAIAGELSIQDYSSIVNWELELYDTQPAQVGGLDKEFIFAGRIDDKLCSWSAIEALLASSTASTSAEDGIVKLVGVFDDEEIGSQLRQGAKGNFLASTIERITESLSSNGTSANILSQTYANSFLVSADVTHAVNPNFLASYLEGHSPRLNVGLVVSADSNGHMTTDSVSTALLSRVAEKTDNKLQLFMIRNDSRSGGTVGPMLSSAMGVRAIDAGIPQLSMHSIRATTGSLDPGLGVKIFKGFLDTFESVDGEFE